MRLVRILNAMHFDPRKQRFTSLAFKNSTGGGISVVSKECIQQQDRTVCDHIKRYYPPPTSSMPPIFWEIAEELLPPEYTLTQQTSPTGDICHYNIEGISDKHAREMLLHCQLDEFRICLNGQSRQLSFALLEARNF